MRFHRLLTPRDFSETSDAAVDVSADLAQRAGADLHLLHVGLVTEGLMTGMARQGTTAPEPDLDARLRTSRDGQSITGPKAVHSHYVRDVAVAPAIVQYSRDHEIDLIAMGSHGRTGFRKFVLGNVTEEVIGLASCAVLAVRRTNLPLTGQAVVVGVDFSRSSKQAVADAAAIAKLLDSTLHVVHAIPEWSDSVETVPDDSPPEAMPECHRRLRAFVGEVAEVETECYCEAGNAASVLGEYASHVEAGVVAVGARGHSELRQIFLGSVARQVTRTAPCSVLVSMLARNAGSVDGPASP